MLFASVSHERVLRICIYTLFQNWNWLGNKNNETEPTEEKKSFEWQEQQINFGSVSPFLVFFYFHVLDGFNVCTANFRRHTYIYRFPKFFYYYYFWGFFSLFVLIVCFFFSSSLSHRVTVASVTVVVDITMAMTMAVPVHLPVPVSMAMPKPGCVLPYMPRCRCISLSHSLCMLMCVLFVTNL